MTAIPLRPNCAPTPLSIVEQQLLGCLDQRLPVVETWLRKRFPSFIAQEAIDLTKRKAVEAIATGLAERMPEPVRRKWLWVVAYREAVTLMRRRKIDPLPPEDMLPLRRPSSAEEKREIVREALRYVSPFAQVAIGAVHIVGLSKQTSAKCFGLSEATFHRRYDTAIRQLREVVLRLSADF